MRQIPPWWAFGLGVVFFFGLAVQALSIPWTWNGSQLLLIFFLGLVGCIAGWWAIIWFRGGSEAVKRRWKFPYEGQAVSPSSEATGFDYLFWIVIAVLLVLIFYFMQP
jgi:hypothetical protein